MRSEFNYKPDKRAKRLTALITVIVVLAAVFFVLYSSSGYFPIWFSFFVVTIMILYVLSIPRKIRVTEEAFEIHSLVELTTVALEDIVTIRTMDRPEMKFSFPLLASYGFFGYYGWFYNFSEMSLFKVYATQWKNFVRIEDIYETTYVVNCDDPQALIEAVVAARTERLAEIERLESQAPNEVEEDE